jgi:hypothetical protein
MLQKSAKSGCPRYSTHVAQVGRAEALHDGEIRLQVSPIPRTGISKTFPSHILNVRPVFTCFNAAIISASVCLLRLIPSFFIQTLFPFIKSHSHVESVSANQRCGPCVVPRLAKVPLPSDDGL